MNRNKCFAIMAYILPAIVFFAVILHAWYYFIEYPLCHVGDVYQYYIQISTGNITDWWSSLYMYECRWMTNFLSHVFGLQENACYGMFVMKCITIFSIFVAIELLVYILSHANASIMLLSSIMLCLAQIAVSITSFNVITSVIGRLDFCGSALLFFSIIGSISLNLFQKKILKSIMVVFIFLALLHACLFRKPFLAIAPIIVQYICAMLYDFKLFSINNIIKSMFMFGLFIITVIGVQKSLPNHRHTYPASVMISSELRIASVLNGERHYLQNIFPAAHQENNVLAADTYAYLPIETAEDWRALLDEYVKYAKMHPIEVLEARFLLCVEFCTSNDVPYVIKKILQIRHPYLQTGETAFAHYIWPNSNRSFIISCFYYLCLLLWIIGTILPVLYYYRYIKERGGDASFHFMLKTGLYLGLLSLASMLCYMVVVVPSPDFRYRSQMLMICTTSVLWWYVMYAQFRICKQSDKGMSEGRNVTSVC